MIDTEEHAIKAEAEARLAELVALRDLLLPDRDDSEVMSELTTIESQISACQELSR